MAGPRKEVHREDRRRGQGRDAASDTYEQKLQSEISKSSAPTLFQVNGPTGLANWKDYCLDLTGSKVLGELANDALKLEGDGKVYAIDYVEEDYGIIYNKDLLTKAGYSADDQAATLEFLNWVVTDDEATKAIAEDMGLTMPFKSAKEVANPLAKIAKEYVEKAARPWPGTSCTFLPRSGRRTSRPRSSRTPRAAPGTTSRRPSSTAGRPRRRLPSKRSSPVI